ncbi:MAG: helix-turn-helix domain-containing protein [Candidatus Pacearchaeota archaeon]|jgi:sugar-specific transcriptional regulator TrmB
MDIETALKAFGLTEKEIEVYLSLLDLGSSKVNEIAEKSKIIRETTYGILKSLIEKGLVSYVIKSGVKYFSASEPKKLIYILKDKEEKINEVLSELEARNKHEYKKLNVEVYEGKEGLKTVFKEIIQEQNKEIYGMINKELADKLVPYFIFKVSKERKEKRIKSLMIVSDSKEDQKLKKADKEEMRETRFSPLLDNFKTGIYIFGDKVAFLTFDENEPNGIIIDNKSISDAIKKIHGYLWNESQK